MIQALRNQKSIGKCGFVIVRYDEEVAKPLLQKPLLRNALLWAVNASKAAKAGLPAIAVLGTSLLTFSAVVWHPVAKASALPAFPQTTVRISVGRGDSLWQLARQYGDPEVAMDDRVESIARLNGLNASLPLIAGQHLLVRVENPVALRRQQVSLAVR